MLNIIASVIFAILGALSIVAAIFNFEWFFSTENGKLVVKLFGRAGARLFYGVAGGLILYMAYYLYDVPVSN